MDQWLSVDQSYVAPHTRTLAVERILKPRAGQTADTVAVEAAESGLRTAFVAIDKALNDNPFLVGASLSLADISLSPYVASLPMIGAAHLIDGLPRLRTWWATFCERPSARRIFA
jgi:glutathione S-transferase